jgi:hypothetical protein
MGYAVRLTALLSTVVGCAPTPNAAAPAVHATEAVPVAHLTPAKYDDPATWLCLPGRDDACARDLSATLLHPDGSRTIERSEPAARDAKADCFYVYPTVDVSLAPGNHDDFRNLEPMAGAALTQAARLRQACAIYAPLYRQVTIGSYFHDESRLDAGLAFGYADVEAAFRTYLAKYNHGRPIVLVGHSQGADMVIRLLKTFFDHDAELRSRLVLAMPIGWYVEVPRGKTTGGTFENVPICTSPDEGGCVVAYRTYEAGSNVQLADRGPRAGNVNVCVDPAAVGSDALAPLSRAYLRVSEGSRRYLHTEGIDTPFVELEGFYQGQCVEGPEGFRYLAISAAAGDPRKNPVTYELLPLHKHIGLHMLDFQLLEGDLVNLVTRHVGVLR